MVFWDATGMEWKMELQYPSFERRRIGTVGPELKLL